MSSTTSKLEQTLDRLWLEWKDLNDYPESDEKAYASNLWFFMFLKKALKESEI